MAARCNQPEILKVCNTPKETRHTRVHGVSAAAHRLGRELPGRQQGWVSENEQRASLQPPTTLGYPLHQVQRVDVGGDKRV